MTADKKKALGRGLDALLPSSRPAAHASTPSSANVAGRVAVAQPPVPAIQASASNVPSEGAHELPLTAIERNPFQTRTHLDEIALAELAASIRSSGVVQPVLVRALPPKDGTDSTVRYQLIAGERRWLASQRAGRATVPAIVRKVSDEQALEITIIENLQREDLNPLEQARAFERLGRDFQMTQEQIAQRTGKDRASISNYLRLLKLPIEVQAHVDSGALTFGHAKALMPLEDAEVIAKMAKIVIKDALSVRKTEELIAYVLRPEARLPKPARVVDPNVREAERTLRSALGVKVEIHDKKGKGKIILRYASLEDFDRIVETLGR